MSRIAILDLGTNTFNLLIVDILSDKSYALVFKTKIAVKLGEGAINKGFIAPIPFQRGLDAMRLHNETMLSYKVQSIRAIATSAIRDANNGGAFVSQVKQLTDIDINVISGDEEAELIYQGVKNGVAMNLDTSLIIDIGGGSTEFIIANKDSVFWKQSFPLGASRLVQYTEPSEPITSAETDKLLAFLEVELVPLFSAIKQFPVTELIGSSGAFDSLAAMIALQYYTIERIEGKTEYAFLLSDFQKLYDTIIASTTSERLAMKGLIPMRVDMIVVSCILLNFIIQKLKVSTMRSSTYSLKEGVLYELLNK